MNTSKKCLECGDPIFGRIDKKFCGDYCRNAFNNRVHKDQKNRIRNTNNRLRKNHRILCELNTLGKTKVARNKLFDKGFDFELITSLYTTKSGNKYFYVYNQGYLELDNEQILLVRQE